MAPPDKNETLFEIDEPAAADASGDSAGGLPHLSGGAEPAPQPVQDEIFSTGEEAPESGLPAKPLSLMGLIAIGGGLALLAAVVFDTLKLREARVTVEAVRADITVARAQLQVREGELAAVRATAGAAQSAATRDACDRLANYIDAPGMRLLTLHGEGKGKGASANFYLPANGEGCLVLTGTLPDGPLALWQLSGATSHRLAAIAAGPGPRRAAAALAGAKGKLVVTLERDAAAAIPSGDAILIGNVE